MTRAILLLVALSGCSLMRAPSVVVEQRAITVPSPDDVRAMQGFFADEAAAADLLFDDAEPLRVIWHAEGEVLEVRHDIVDDEGRPFKVLGRTLDSHSVEVSSVPLFMHELAHVLFLRNLGDDDVNHADPPGPWTAETDSLIRRATERYLTRPPAAAETETE